MTFPITSLEAELERISTAAARRDEGERIATDLFVCSGTMILEPPELDALRVAVRKEKRRGGVR